MDQPAELHKMAIVSNRSENFIACSYKCAANSVFHNFCYCLIFGENLLAYRMRYSRKSTENFALSSCCNCGLTNGFPFGMRSFTFSQQCYFMFQVYVGCHNVTSGKYCGCQSFQGLYRFHFIDCQTPKLNILRSFESAYYSARRNISEDFDLHFTLCGQACL